MHLKLTLLAIFSLVFGIGLIIWRKLPYLKKLPIETDPTIKADFWVDFFPEINHSLRSINFRQYQGYLLRETEKLLRRLRVASLKLERLTTALLDRVRGNGHYQHDSEKEGGAEVFSSQPPAVILSDTPPSLWINGQSKDYKKEERSLILDIARDPKNPELYRRLGDIYVSLGNFRDAKESLETVLKLDPEDSKTKEKLAKVEGML